MPSYLSDAFCFGDRRLENIGTNNYGLTYTVLSHSDISKQSRRQLSQFPSPIFSPVNMTHVSGFDDG